MYLREQKFATFEILREWDISGPNRYNSSLFWGFNSFLTEKEKDTTFPDRNLCDFKIHINGTSLWDETWSLP